MTSRLAGALVIALASIMGACGASQVVAAPEAPVGTTATTSRADEGSPSPADSATSDTAKPPAPGASAASGGPAEPPPREVSARHVLVQYVGSERAPAAVVRTREQAEALAEKVAQRAKRGESFTRLATEYSDEPGAAARGGALGKFTRGKMAPAFEDAAFRLKVGEISDVVETPFGFHVILRTE